MIVKLKPNHTPIGDGHRAIKLDYLYKNIGEPDANGCCPWTGMTNNIGYPFIPFWNSDIQKGRMMLATRALLMIELGREILPRHNANHSCHNRWCMNIDHISEGTQVEKMRKLKADKRFNRRGGPYGSYDHKQYNRSYKYTEEEIQFCRSATFTEIQERFGVTRDRAYTMKRGMTTFYRWLPFDNK